MMNMGMMNTGMMNNMNMGMMNPGMMNNMNMMNMAMQQRMANSMGNLNLGINLSQNLKIEDKSGWTLTYEKDGKKTTMKISPNKTVYEAGNMYKLETHLKEDFKLKYKHESKYLDTSLQLCQSGLMDGDTINVEVAE